MKTKVFVSFFSALFAISALFTSCEKSTVGCNPDTNKGYPFYFQLLRFDTEKDFSRNIIMISYDKPVDSNDTRYGQLLTNGNNPVLHNDYVMSFENWPFCYFYLLSLTYDDLRNHEDGWLGRNWKDYIVEDLVISKVYNAEFTTCKSDDSYYKKLPYFANGEGDEEGEDCLFFIKDYTPHYYISREKMNRLIDNGTILDYFTEYKRPYGT